MALDDGLGRKSTAATVSNSTGAIQKGSFSFAVVVPLLMKMMVLVAVVLKLTTIAVEAKVAR